MSIYRSISGISRSSPINSSSHLLARQLSSSARRLQPEHVPKPVSPHVGIYRTFGRPFLKVFLGAVFTYQVIYWSWLRLELNEIEREKEAEIKVLETQARGLAAAKKEKA